MTKVGDKFGLQFSKEKTKCIHVCRKLNCNPDSFHLYHSNILRVENLRFLGINFSNKYKFDHHFNIPKSRLTKDYNLVKMLTSKKCSINQDTLRKIALYRYLFQRFGIV